MAEKARYWAGICYPENMLEDWQDCIAEKLQVPFCYCIHDKDVTTEKEERKTHVHIMITFPNTTTKKCALSILNKLSDRAIIPCCSTVEQVHNVRFMYNYFIHDTEDSRKKGKFQYSSIERISGNGFDIGLYEQLSSDDKLRMAKQLTDICILYDFRDIKELYMYVDAHMDINYFEVAKTNNNWLSNICKSNFLQSVRDSGTRSTTTSKE